MLLKLAFYVYENGRLTAEGCAGGGEGLGGGTTGVLLDAGIDRFRLRFRFSSRGVNCCHLQSYLWLTPRSRFGHQQQQRQQHLQQQQHHICVVRTNVLLIANFIDRTNLWAAASGNNNNEHKSQESQVEGCMSEKLL